MTEIRQMLETLKRIENTLKAILAQLERYARLVNAEPPQEPTP